MINRSKKEILFEQNDEQNDVTAGNMTTKYIGVYLE